MYKTILVPLDMSKRAEAIFPHVEQLAQCTQAGVVLLHVVEPLRPSYDIYASEAELAQLMYDRNIGAAQEYMAICQKVFQDKGIAVETRIVSGDIVATIIKVADEIKADLIAMASHGRSGLAQVFYGSVATGILHRVDRPLLVIRAIESKSAKPIADPIEQVTDR